MSAAEPTKTRGRRPRLAGLRTAGDRFDRTFAERAAFLAQREAALDRYVAAYRKDRQAYLDAVDAVVAPFGLDPAAVDPPLVDLLTWVVPENGHWRWQGRTNNKGVAVIRYRQLAKEGGLNLNTEWSACQQLHRLLAGGHAPPGAMHPRCDAPFQCVLLAHRCPTCATERAGGAVSVA